MSRATPRGDIDLPGTSRANLATLTGQLETERVKSYRKFLLIIPEESSHWPRSSILFEPQMKCPFCSHECQISPEHVGKRYACSNCARAFPVPPAPPGVPAIVGSEHQDFPSKSLTHYAIRTSEISKVVESLPDRMVVIRDPYSTEQIPMQRLRGMLSTRDDDCFLYDESGWFVVQKLETSSGWLRLTFGWRYAVNYVEHSDELLAELDESSVELLQSCFGRVYASYKSGLTLQTAIEHLSELMYVADNLSHLLRGHSHAVELVTDPVDLFEAAVNEWRTNPGYEATRMIGGGMGMQGILQGIAIAGAFNMLVDRHNKKVGDAHLERIQAPLNFSIQQLRATQELIREKSSDEGS